MDKNQLLEEVKNLPLDEKTKETLLKTIEAEGDNPEIQGQILSFLKLRADNLDRSANILDKAADDMKQTAQQMTE